MNDRELLAAIDSIVSGKILPRLERIEDALYGNGQEGLVREVAKNTEFRLEFKKTKNMLYGTLLTAVVSLGVHIVRAVLGV